MPGQGHGGQAFGQRDVLLGLAGAQARDDLVPIHVAQRNVADQHVRPLRVRPAQQGLQRGAPARKDFRARAPILEHVREHVARFVLVVDQHDLQPPQVGGRARRRGGQRQLGDRPQRELHRIGHGAVRLPRLAEAPPLALRLGGQRRRIERRGAGQQGIVRRRREGAGAWGGAAVRDGQPRHRPVARQPQGHPAAGRRGRQGVRVQVPDQALQGAGIARDARRLGADEGVEADAALAQHVARGIEHAGHQGDQVDRLARRRAVGFLQGAELPLQLPHLRIDGAAREQLLVGAGLHQPAMVEHHDAVGVDDGGEPVRDDQRGVVAGDALELLLDGALGARVQRRGRFVEDHDRGPLEQRPRDGDALPFPARELQAAFAHRRVVAPGQALDEFVDARRARRLLDLGAAGLGPAVADVVGDGVVEQQRVLRHDAHAPAQAADPHLPEVLAVDQHPSAVGIVEAQQQPRQRGLAGAAAADHGQRAAGRDAQIDVPEDLPAGFIAEGHVVEHHLPRARGQRRQPRLVARLRRQPQQAADPLGGDEGLARLAHDQAQRVERQADLDDVGVDQHQVADRHPRARHLLAGQQHDDADAGGDDAGLPHVELGQRPLVADRRRHPLGQHPPQAGGFALLHHVEFDRLVVEEAVDHPAALFRVQVVQVPLQRRAPADQQRGVDAIGDEGGGHGQGEPRAVARHEDDHHRDDLHRRGQQREQCRAHQESHPRGAALQVARHAAGLARTVETGVQRLQVAEHAQGEVRHRALRDRRKHHVPQLGQQAAGKAQQGVAQQQEDRQRERARRAQGVDDVLERHGHGDHEQLGRHQQGQRGRRAPPLPPEHRPDGPQYFPPCEGGAVVLHASCPFRRTPGGRARGARHVKSTRAAQFLYPGRTGRAAWSGGFPGGNTSHDGLAWLLLIA